MDGREVRRSALAYRQNVCVLDGIARRGDRPSDFAQNNTAIGGKFGQWIGSPRRYRSSR